MSNYFNNLYQNESIYILNYPNGTDVYTSNGILHDIKGTKINYQCNVGSNSLGSPIILLKNNKVIGIHNNNNKTNMNLNSGMLLIEPIIEFQLIPQSNDYMLVIKKPIIQASNNLIIQKSPNKKFKKSNSFTKNNKENNVNNIISNQINLNLIKSIKDQFKQPPLIGLENLGNTCYMNATLQCLCSIKRLVNYFKYSATIKELYNNDKNKSKLFSSFKLLIDNLYPNTENLEGNNRKKFSPVDIKIKIENSYHFKGLKKIDPKDLFIFLVNNLHLELNIKKNQNNVENNSNIDKTNKILMCQNFFIYFKANYHSIISDIFYGSKYTIKKCNGCMAKSYDFQTYYYLEFPLDSIHIFKANTILNGIFHNYELDLNECFSFYQSEKAMISPDDAIMRCEYCNDSYDITSTNKLATGPKILVIILNRGKGLYNKIRIKFPEYFDITQYIEMNDNTRWKYEIIGVISLIGEDIEKGHFISFCKNPINSIWYKYNDDIVEQVNNFQNEVVSSHKPYILFYHLDH